MRVQKCIFKMIDGPNSLFINYGDNIETNLIINMMRSDIMVGSLCDAFDFCLSHRIFRWLPGPSGPCFHFNDDQPAVYFCNKVQFFMGGMPISFPNAMPFGQKVVLSPLFALNTQFVVFSHVVCERNVLIFVHKFSKI